MHSIIEARGVASTAERQIACTMAMQVYDAYQGLLWLERHQQGAVDMSRVGLAGWSLGGGAALYAGLTSVAEACAGNGGPRFAVPSDWQARPEISGLIGKQLEWFKDAPVFVDDEFGAPKTNMFEGWALRFEGQAQRPEDWAPRFWGSDYWPRPAYIAVSELGGIPPSLHPALLVPYVHPSIPPS